MWLIGFLRKFLALSGIGKGPDNRNLSIVETEDSSDDTGTIEGEVVLDDIREKRLIGLAQDISNLETDLDRDLQKTIAESILLENQTRSREVELKAENDKRVAKHRDNRLVLRSQQTQREQDRLDEIAREEAERQRFASEQEEFRKNMEQFFQQEQIKSEQRQKEKEKKEQARQARLEQKAKDKRRRHRRRKVIWASRRRNAAAAFARAKTGARNSFSKKWFRLLLGILLISLVGYLMYATETGQSVFYALLGWVEAYQNILFSIVGIALLAALIYWLVKTGRWSRMWAVSWPAALSAGKKIGTGSWWLVRTRAFMALAPIAIGLGLIYWVYSQGYFSNLSLPAAPSIAWPAYGNYFYGTLAAILIIALLVWLLRSPSRRATVRMRLSDAGYGLRRFADRLSIAVGVLLVIGLAVVALFGALIGSSALIIAAFGLMPLLGFGLRPSLGLWFRFLITFLAEVIALAVYLPSPY